jgi:AcrR family transcriptional regulator
MGITERKARERLLRETQILDAAHQVFHEVGFSAATMDQIAERAELAKGTVYIYFKSKEELYYSLLAKGLDVLIELLEGMLKRSPSPGDFFRETARAFFTYYRDHTDYFRIFMIMQQEDMQAKLSPKLFKQINLRVTTILKLLSGEIQKLIDAGYLSATNAWSVTDILWGAFSGITQLALTRERLKVRKSNIEEVLLLCFELIHRGLSRGTGGSQAASGRPRKN